MQKLKNEAQPKCTGSYKKGVYLMTSMYYQYFSYSNLYSLMRIAEQETLLQYKRKKAELSRSGNKYDVISTTSYSDTYNKILKIPNDQGNLIS